MSYAYKRDGVWVEISGSFTINETTYPYAWLEHSTIEELMTLGVHKITTPPIPNLTTNQRLSGSHLVDDLGLPVLVYDIEDLSVNDVKQIRLTAIDNRAIQAFNTGFSPSHIAFAGEKLQCRDDSDRTNWLVAEKEYVKAVGAGYGSVEQAIFRTESNQSITISFTDAVAVLAEMTAWGFTITKRKWALKDAEIAGTPYDIEAGWPI